MSALNAYLESKEAEDDFLDKDSIPVDENQKNGNFDDMKMETETTSSKTSQPAEIDDDEVTLDRYKPEGKVILKIDRFNEFARAASPELQQRLSASVYIRGLPWKILAIPRDVGRNPMHRRTGEEPKSLGFFLQCNGEANDTTWNCTASATLRIHSQKEGIEDNQRKISHTFYSKENDWGYSQYMSCETLMDAENGFILNNTIILSAEVSADAPHGVHWDSKKHAGHIGLKNQGATCYMNSILQTLFFTNKLRKAVYMMPTEEDDPECSVALAMQRVFYELQFSVMPVGTKKLTKSFGWDCVDSFLQHDVQELCRVLLDNLESKMKSTVVADTIPSLFKGRMKSYIKCKRVPLISFCEESFYDVQLNVKGKPNITESFRDYTNPEVLDGDNKYDAGEHGLQPAEKGVKFLAFPPVLHLQLMRFQYDPGLDANVKINDRFEFPDELTLNEFVDEQGVQDDYTYLLHAVLVHSGDFHGGHYVVFINTNMAGKARWCKFDDDVVSRATFRDAVYANYGGDDPEMMNRSFTNAYMLVYVKKSSVSDVLCGVSELDIPDHLKVRFEGEKRRDIQRKKEKEEATFLCDVTLVTDEVLQSHTGFDLYDYKELEQTFHKTKVGKTTTVAEFYNHVAKNMGYKETEFRLWGFENSQEKYSMVGMKRNDYVTEIFRPKYLLKYEPNDLYEQNGGFSNAETLDSDQTFYLELGKYSSVTNKRELKPYDEDTDLLFFLKFFNHERNATEYKGVILLKSDRDLSNHVPEIASILDLPADTLFNLYVEIRPDIIQKCRNLRCLIRDDRLLNVNGGILIAEVADKVDPEHDTRNYFKNLFDTIEVEAHVNVDGFGLNSDNAVNVPPIKGHISLSWDLNRVCQWIGSEIDYDPAKILLWKVSQHNEKPTMFLHENCDKVTTMQALSLTPSTYDPRAGRCYKLFYSKLPILIGELENRRHMRIQALYDKFHVTELTVFPEKSGTVQSILDEAARVFKFAENGSHQLRLVHVSVTANCLRVFQVFDKSLPISEINHRLPSSFLRVEEIPQDQLEVGPNEHLFPVAHFDKEPTRMFGVPFFIKIINDEKISNIRCRIKEILDVQDCEFEKYKFCIVMSARIVRELDNDDDNAVVNLAELLHTHITTPTAAPYLGIDHMNKSRGMRGSHAAEKPIIIHN